MTDQPILWWLAHNTLFAAILTGIVCGACRLLRLRPAVCHVLWLVVLVKLAMPPLLTWPWSANWPKELAVSRDLGKSFDVSPRDHHRFALAADLSRRQGISSEPADGHLSQEVGPDKEEFLIVPGNSWAPSSTELPEPDAPVSAHPVDWRASKIWPWGLIGLWVAASLAMVALQGIRVYRFRRRVAGAALASGALAAQVNRLAKQLGLPSPRTLIAPGIASPMVWGLGRPTLLWPASLVGQLSPTCQQAVIVHELAHLRRRDHWVGWLQLAAGCVWWWHPLYRYVSRQVRANAELACDAWVVNAMPTARRAYADALLEVSHLLSRHTAPMPVLSMAAGRVDLERRLVMIMRESASCKLSLRSLIILGAVALIALPGWSLSQQSGDPAGEEPIVEEQREVDRDGTGDLELKVDEMGLEMADGEGVSEDGSLSKAKEGDRLDRLERQLKALLKEVESLRGKKQGNPKTGENSWAGFKDRRGESTYTLGPQATDLQDVYMYKSWNVQGDDKPIILSRATYKMPRAKADALASFLRDQLKEQSLETKVEEDAIVITALPEVQKTISQFIGLVQGKTFAFESKDLNIPVQK